MNPPNAIDPQSSLPAPLGSGAAKFPWVRLLLHPAHSLPTAASPVLIAVALAVHNHVFSPLPALLAFLASWFVHIGGLYAENYWLLTRYAALREHPELSSAVENGSLPLAALRRVTIGCFVLALAAGGYLVTSAGIVAPALGLIGVSASLGYCAVAKRGLGECFFFAMFGIVAVAGAYYCQAAQHYAAPGNWSFVPNALPANALVLGWPLGAIIVAVMLVDDLSDIAVDTAKRWRTRPVVWGARWGRREYLALMILAYSLPFWFWRGLNFSAWILLPLATLPWAAWAVRQVYTIEPAQVEPMSPRTAGIGLLYSILLAIGIVLS